MSKRERTWLVRIFLLLAFILLIALVLMLRAQTDGLTEMYRATLEAYGRGQ